MDHYRQLKGEIVETALACKRNPAEIRLVVVSKGQSWERAACIYQEGCRDFGENKLQEALPKIETAPVDCRWHFIGTLQKNKVKKVVGAFALIHSVDSLELAKKISEVAVEKNERAAILLQANTSGEKSKHGMSADECLREFGDIQSLPGLDVQGLMTIAPLIEDEGVIRDAFRNLRILRDTIVGEYHPLNGLPHLSMGMSHDFRLAIAEGATILRIGTKIWS